MFLDSKFGWEEIVSRTLINTGILDSDARLRIEQNLEESKRRNEREEKRAPERVRSLVDKNQVVKWMIKWVEENIVKSEGVCAAAVDDFPGIFKFRVAKH